MKYLFLFFIILMLFISVSAVQAQDGLTVTVPDNTDTIPPVEWNPDNWILIIVVGFVIAFGALGGVVVFFGNKLFLSTPTWARPGIEDTVRSGVVEAISAGQAIVVKTPTPLDDYALELLTQLINEAVNKVLEQKG